jgi:opacity protein-like surface antigen
MNESGPFGFNNGVGRVTSPGPTWSALAGVEFLPWLALEGRYVGMYDSVSASVSPSGGFLASAVLGVVRLTVPLPYVHPYGFGGIGYYSFDFTGPSASVMHSSSEPGVPMGVGVDVPLTYHLSVGAEWSYNFQIGESFAGVSTNKIDGGDVTRFDLVLRARL